MPTKILKRCAKSLAYPIWLLALSILRVGSWPASWKEHWITPLYKKKSVSDAVNYRGIHLTSQVSFLICIAFQRSVETNLLTFQNEGLGMHWHFLFSLGCRALEWATSSPSIVPM